MDEMTSSASPLRAKFRLIHVLYLSVSHHTQRQISVIKRVRPLPSTATHRPYEKVVDCMMSRYGSQGFLAAMG
jgi:hypothetical protein